MRLDEFAPSLRFFKAGNRWWIKDRRISDDDAQMIQDRMANIKAKYPESYQLKMSQDVLKSIYDHYGK